MRVEEAVGVEVDELREQPPEGVVGSAWTVKLDAAEGLGSSCVASVSRVTTPNVPPPPPFSAQNRSGSCACVDDADLAVGGDDLGLEQARAGRAEALGEAAEAAALHQAGDADGGAAAALDIALRPRRVTA